MTGSTAVDTSSHEALPLLVTDNPDEAHQYITDVYIPHDLETRDGNRLDFRLRYLASDRLTVGHLVYGADSELLVPPMIGCYHMNLTLHGRTMVTQKGRRAATDAGRGGVMFSPTDPFTVRWSPEAVQYAVKLPRRSLEGQLSRLINQPVEQPIRFDLAELRKALRSQLKVHFRYRDYLARETVRTVRPLSLAYFGPVWLLAARRELRDDFRTFRLDRIDDFKILNERFRSEPGKTLHDFLKRDQAWNRRSETVTSMETGND